MKIFKLGAIATIGLLSLGSCSEDQTGFNVQDIPGRCLIEGEIVYNEGTTVENGHFAYNYKPAANLNVTVTIDNSEYGSLTGKSTFTTVTDAEGKYSIEIPAPDKNASVTITTADFRGTRTFITQDNNQIITKTEDVIYRGVYNTTVHSQGIVYANFRCTECNANNPINSMNQVATLKGKIGQGVEYLDPARRNYNSLNEFVGYTNGRVYYVFDGAKADLIVKVSYEGSDYTYNVTSDANGEWTLQVPVYSFPASFDYTVTAMPYNSSYTHYVAVERTYKLNENDTYERTYTDYEGKTLQGFYSQSFTASYGASYPVAAQIVSNDSKVLVFEPLNNGQDTFGYTAGSYSPSLDWRADLIKSLAENN